MPRRGFRVLSAKTKRAIRGRYQDDDWSSPMANFAWHTVAPRYEWNYCLQLAAAACRLLFSEIKVIGQVKMMTEQLIRSLEFCNARLCNFLGNVEIHGRDCDRERNGWLMIAAGSILCRWWIEMEFWLRSCWMTKLLLLEINIRNEDNVLYFSRMRKINEIACRYSNLFLEWKVSYFTYLVKYSVGS